MTSAPAGYIQSSHVPVQNGNFCTFLCSPFEMRVVRSFSFTPLLTVEARGVQDRKFFCAWGGEGRDFYSSWREERTTWGLLVRNFCYCNQTDNWKIIPQYAHLKMSISQSSKILLRKAHDLKSKKKLWDWCLLTCKNILRHSWKNSNGLDFIHENKNNLDKEHLQLHLGDLGNFFYGKGLPVLEGTYPIPHVF